MIFDIRPRQTGKTTQIVDSQWRARGILLVPDRQQVQLVMREHYLPVTGYRERRQDPDSYGIFTADQWLRYARHGRSPKPIYIDNVDMVLRELLGDVRIVTATGEEA